MKIVHLSDTHGFHEGQCEIWLKEIAEEHQPSVVIHSGDFMQHSMKYQDAEDFFKWFMELPFEHKILVPGNHDKWCEQLENDDDLRHAVLPDRLHLLINESVEIEGVKFWGSPYTPEFFDWGFQLYGTEGYDLWNEIPENTDVLITHGPSMGVLDKLPTNESVGCPFLAQRIDELDIKAHLFGHIHDAYGMTSEDYYIAVNSSLLDENYKVQNKPQLVLVKDK